MFGNKKKDDNNQSKKSSKSAFSEKEAKKAAAEYDAKKPDWAVQANIRISQPLGYFPEDVDKYVKNLKEQLKEETTARIQAETKLREVEDQKSKLQNELTKLKLAISIEGLPPMDKDTSNKVISDFGNDLAKSGKKKLKIKSQKTKEEEEKAKSSSAMPPITGPKPTSSSNSFNSLVRPRTDK